MTRQPAGRLCGGLRTLARGVGGRGEGALGRLPHGGGGGRKACGVRPGELFVARQGAAPQALPEAPDRSHPGFAGEKRDNPLKNEGVVQNLPGFSG